MKKKIVGILLATVLCASTMNGCSNVSDNQKEDLKKEETHFLDAVLNAADENNTNSVGAEISMETGESATRMTVEEAADNSNVIESNQALQDISEQEGLSVDVIQKIEKQLDPVVIAAEDSWTEVLDVSEDWKDLIYDLNQEIAEKAVVELINIDLNNSVATYKITTPDVIGFLAENIEQTSSLDKLSEMLTEELSRDNLPVKERKITVPIHIDGADVSLYLEDSEVMDSITGGLYEAFETGK